jgi:alkaline phosphatase
MNRKTRVLTFSIVMILALGSYLFMRLPWFALGGAAQSHTPKYIFIFMADGAGITHMEIARMYSRVVHKEGLNITDKIIKEGSIGLLTTHAADSLSTDSAAAATSMATGCKAKIGAFGSCADGSISKTVLEVAKEKGMRIGLVTNATIYDASPAAFAGHVPNRRFYNLIIDQYLRLGPELLLGGGRNRFLPQKEPGSARKDDSDMIAAFKKQGYTYVSDKQELSRAKGTKILGLFSLGDMSFEIDRDKEREPSVSEMTQAAIRLLEEGNRRGFVAFIENEHVDTAGHFTDVASVIREFREFDRAVGLAYEFYRRHPRETLILVTSDHETGGLGFTLALEELYAGRESKRLAATEEDLKKIDSIPISLKKAAEILGPNPTSDSIDQLMKDYFKGFKLAPDLKKLMLAKQVAARNIYSDPIANCLGLMVANNTQAYWGSTTHTNQPVFVAALGVGVERFRGYQDNTDFAKHLFALLRDKDAG